MAMICWLLTVSKSVMYVIILHIINDCKSCDWSGVKMFVISDYVVGITITNWSLFGY